MISYVKVLVLDFVDCVDGAVVELVVESSGLRSTKRYNLNYINWYRCNITLFQSTNL